MIHVCTVTAEIITVPQVVKSLLLVKKCSEELLHKEEEGSWRRACSYVQREELVKFTWQSGNLAPWLVVSRVAVWRQQAADNLQETDKLDIYTERLQSKGLVTVVHRLRIWWRDLVRNVFLVPYLTETPFFSDSNNIVVAFYFSFQKQQWRHFLFIFP